ncbi:ABC-2 type transport system ATP-binding protein [Halopelagius inordinatus]|uniref:ABC-2 type transport system ATP-binding protein n=1 Tax=Halopelagius inordinatus TaxID=553467 RepID=A0A1I2R7Y2_9EURY|nr:ABC transporter ATP-binding protein [Halopelagius inordinatus]SFG36582.1 ABC-2 type transport system ATP-binding protein [Halopelagius inordinatus]
MEDTVVTRRTPESDSGDDPRDATVGTDASRPRSTRALVVEGISKRFGSGDDAVLAVDDVSFAVDRGSVVGLLGPNGAGKTTLIKSILGIVFADAGSIRIFGTEVGDGRRTVYADVDAMLEGARNDYWRLTVRENLRYFATIGGVDPDSVSARHDRLLERLDLTEKADTPVRELSRGMKQKVSLASVLAGGAELVFLDEPTLGLDVESSRTLRSELRRLAAEDGLTIVVSSHDMSVIEDVCDRVVVMSDGRIVADDTVDALLQRADRNTVRITSPDLDDETLASLRAQFDVRGSERRGDSVRIEVAAAGDELYALMDHLRDADVALEHVRTAEPDLEDVFVSLTGDANGLAGSAAESRWSQ